jgi:hypothetical protein
MPKIKQLAIFGQDAIKNETVNKLLDFSKQYQTFEKSDKLSQLSPRDKMILDEVRERVLATLSIHNPTL